MGENIPMVRQFLIQRALEDCVPADYCDPEISRAIEACKCAFKPSDSLRSIRSDKLPVRSIERKVMKHFNAPFRLFLTRENFTPTTWSEFSDLLKLDADGSDIQLLGFCRSLIRISEINYSDNLREQQRVSDTADSLRVFNTLCHAYTPTRFLTYNSIEGDTVTRREPSRHRIDKMSYGILRFSHSPWCELCCRLAYSHQVRINRIDGGERLASKDLPLDSELSDRFCSQHCTHKNPLYKNDRKRRGHFNAMMRLIIEVRIIKGLSPISPEVLRAHAHAIAFQEVRPLPKSIEEVLEFFLDNPYLPRRRENNLDLWLVSMLDKVISDSERNGYDPVAAESLGIGNRDLILQTLLKF